MCHNSANTEVKLQKSREDQVPHGWASSLRARPQRRLDGTRPAGSESSLQSHRGPGAPVARLLTGICHFCGQKSWSAWLAPCALWGGSWYLASFLMGDRKRKLAFNLRPRLKPGQMPHEVTCRDISYFWFRSLGPKDKEFEEFCWTPLK